MPWSYSVLDPVSQAYPKVQGRSPTCYSPVRHSSTPKGLSVRLACVKHAASVRPEPGSNSPNKNNPTKKARWNSNQNNLIPNQSKLAKKQPHPENGRRGVPPRHGKTNKQKPPNTLLSSQTTRPVSRQPHYCTPSSGADQPRPSVRRPRPWVSEQELDARTRCLK